MPKILWCGDACVKTGFEYVSRGFLTQLQARGWDVIHLGLGYVGDPHDYPWTMYPPISDTIGAARLKEIVTHERPDVVLILNDAWGAASYLPKMPEGIPTVLYPPVDAPNQPWGREISAMAVKYKIPVHVICPTQFGVDELVKGGYVGPTSVVGYGIDLSKYPPIETKDARRHLGWPEDVVNGFVVGNVNRNAARKRLDLTVRAFAEWIREEAIDDAYLLLHCSPSDPWGWDLFDLARYYGGLQRKIILTHGKTVLDYVPTERMPYIYAALDVQISTTVGEGWGIPHMEGMAYTEQLVPEYSALGEWARGGCTYYRVADHEIQPGQINTIWAVPDIQDLKRHLTSIYHARPHTEAAERARRHVEQPHFSWDAQGAAMDAVLRSLLPTKTKKLTQPSLDFTNGIL